MATPTEAQPSASPPSLGARERAARFCRRFGLRVPIMQAPMAGACPAGLASTVANAGGMGGLGAQMGTSVKMIEDHYGHVTPVKNADRILQGLPRWEPIAAAPQEAR